MPLSLSPRQPHNSEGPPITLTTLAGTTLGLLLPAFYLIPAAWQRRYVQITMATIDSMRPQDHFLFHRMPGQTPDDLFHNDVVLTASIIALILLTAIAAAYVFALLNRESRTTSVSSESPTTPPAATSNLPSQTWVPSSPALATTVLPLTILILFLLTPPSLPLWNHIPQLAFLQFAWRLCALFAVIALALFATLRIPPCFQLHRKGWSTLLSQPAIRSFATILLAATLILPAYFLFHQACSPTGTPTAIAQIFHGPLGFEPTDEYTPATADNDQLHPPTPPYRLTDDQNSPTPSGATPGPAPSHLTLNPTTPQILILNRRNYPTWQPSINGHPAPVPPRDDGLIALDLPPGPANIDLHDHRSPDRNLGLLLSLLALATLLILVKPPKPLQTP